MRRFQAANWDFDKHKGRNHLWRLRLSRWKKTFPIRAPNGRIRDNGEDRSRVGRPMTYTLADKGLNTTIDVHIFNTGIALPDTA